MSYIDLRLFESQVKRWLSNMLELEPVSPKPSCYKCSGDGWLSRHELSNPDFDGMLNYLNEDNVKYKCDECNGSG
jgi:hypothetical protein